MKDEAAIQRCRSRGRCELCGQSPVDVHHLMSRGAGRVDHDWNLVALCRPCHRVCEANVAYKALAWDIACRREGVSEERIRQKVYDLRRGVTT